MGEMGDGRWDIITMMAIRLGEFLAASAVTLSPIGNAGLGRWSCDPVARVANHSPGCLS